MAADSVFSKLNLTGQRELVVLDAPDSFQAELRRLPGVTVLTQLQRDHPVTFALVFATRKSQVDAIARELVKVAEGDPILWFAYPKGTSKRYTCDFNRDNGWDVLAALGFRPVRQVAIDEDWSALRFRRAQFVKSSR